MKVINAHVSYTVDFLILNKVSLKSQSVGAVSMDGNNSANSYCE